MGETSSDVDILGEKYLLYVDIYILIPYWVGLSVRSSTIEATFPLSNFKTKHIFRILMTLRKFLRLWRALKGGPKAPKIIVCFFPQFFFLSFFYRRRRRPQMGAGGTLKAAPEAPVSRRARDIPPKAGVSRVLFINRTYEN